MTSRWRACGRSDRYTVQVQTKQPRPRLIESHLHRQRPAGAVARRWSRPTATRSWATGGHGSVQACRVAPQLADGVRAQPPATAARRRPAAGRRCAAKPGSARFKGASSRGGRVVIDVVVEDQPRWLAFLNNEHDFIERVPRPSSPRRHRPQARTQSRQARHARQVHRGARHDATVYNMEDPWWVAHARQGGPARARCRWPTTCAKRSASRGGGIGRARAGAGGASQPGLRPEPDPELQYNPPRPAPCSACTAKVDKDGDGWRDLPDGSSSSTARPESDALSRSIDELWDRAPLRHRHPLMLKVAPWPDNLKSRPGRQLPDLEPVGSFCRQPRQPGQSAAPVHGPAKGHGHPRASRWTSSTACSSAPAPPDGPSARRAAQAWRLVVAYAPTRCMCIDC